MSLLSTKVAAAAVSVAQSTDVYATTKTAAWNGRDVTKVNVKASLEYGVAKVATLINKLLVALFATPILASPASSDSLKNRAALVLTKHFDKPNAGAVIVDMFANLPAATRNAVEGRIYAIDQAADATNVALQDPVYGQTLRTNDPTNATVKAALRQVLSA